MKFKVGDKVKLPIDKRTLSEWNWQYCLVRKGLCDGQDFLFVHKIDGKKVELISGRDSVEYFSTYKEEDLELYEEQLPEKWYIERTKENYLEINEWLNTYYPPKVDGYTRANAYIYSEDIDGSRYPRMSFRKKADFTEINIETFRKITSMKKDIEIKVGLRFRAAYDTEIYIVTEIKDSIISYKQVSDDSFTHTRTASIVKSALKDGTWVVVEGEKQFIGYVLKKGCEQYLKAASILALGENISTLDTTEEVLFHKASISEMRLKNAGVLDEWFDKVYKEENVEETVLLGDKKIEVKIGKGYIKADGKTFEINLLKSVHTSLTFKSANGYKIEIPFIKVGCTTFPFSQLEEIIRTYEELNK